MEKNLPKSSVLYLIVKLLGWAIICDHFTQRLDVRQSVTVMSNAYIMCLDNVLGLDFSRLPRLLIFKYNW